MPQTLILASTSPYRRELLAASACLSKLPTQTDETRLPMKRLKQWRLRLSEAKARAVVW
jgi:predicted house-cleaning NTP pyrophosphatase (Maf/HAM1 superfamily)